MSESGSDQTLDVDGAAVEVSTEYLSADLLAEGTIEPLLSFPALFGATIRAVLGDSVEWHVVFTDNLQKSVSDRTSDAEYSDDRGSNTVAARTLIDDDGVVWFIMGTAILNTLEDASDESVDRLRRNIIHLGMHEAHHAVLALRGEAEKDFEDKIHVDQIEWLYRKGCSINLNEFRIERTANTICPSDPPRSATIESDIRHFADTYDRSKSILDEDLSRAANMIMSAGNELAKCLAYLAAELEPTEADNTPTPQPLPARWNEHVGDFWPRFYRAYRSAPPADEAASATVLEHSLADLCRLMPEWMLHNGIAYLLAEDGSHLCYWTK